MRSVRVVALIVVGIAVLVVVLRSRSRRPNDVLTLPLAIVTEPPKLQATSVADAEALDALRKAWNQAPNDVALSTKLARRLLDHNDLDGAQKHFRALLLQPLDGGEITQAEVFFHLGEILVRKDEPAKAIEMLKRALQMEPSLARAQDLMAQLTAKA